MTRSFDYDVAVVGASIAGCTAATLFARAGLQVALIERHRDPNAYKALCTHYIQASATPAIGRLGLDTLIERAGGIRNGIDVWTRWGWVRARSATHGYSICGWTLDPILRRLAANTPSVYLMLGWRADDLLGQDGAVHGLMIRDRSGRPRDIRTRLVVGADGNHSRAAELAGAKTTTRPNSRFGYFALPRPAARLRDALADVARWLGRRLRLTTG
jgi:2-polyprenyl-6-methoxyphenol hydroxylase-like FAD-dependent oxidoreductase